MAETRATDALPDPDNSDGTGVGRRREATTSASRWQKVIGSIGLVVVLWAGNQLFDQFFPSGPGPGGPPGGGPPGENQEHGPPGENQDQEIDTEDDGGHDPSQFGQ